MARKNRSRFLFFGRARSIDRNTVSTAFVGRARRGVARFASERQDHARAIGRRRLRRSRIGNGSRTARREVGAVRRRNKARRARRGANPPGAVFSGAVRERRSAGSHRSLEGPRRDPHDRSVRSVRGVSEREVEDDQGDDRQQDVQDAAAAIPGSFHVGPRGRVGAERVGTRASPRGEAIESEKDVRGWSAPRSRGFREKNFGAVASGGLPLRFAPAIDVRFHAEARVEGQHGEGAVSWKRAQSSRRNEFERRSRRPGQRELPSGFPVIARLRRGIVRMNAVTAVAERRESEPYPALSRFGW